MYEGIAKLLNPNWSSVGYLLDSQGIFSGFFHSLAGNPDLLAVVDFMNIYGLMAIGFGLIVGLFTNIASIAGIVLLSMYYLSHPPFVGLRYAVPAEGNYLVVNKTLIEVFVFAIFLVFPTGRIIGLDRLIFKSRKEK
jgi:thiosulfate dehydrogenase [quinone] large subunit